MPLTFRDATKNDIATILTLSNGGRVVGDNDDPALAGTEPFVSAFAAIDSDPNHRLIVTELAGEPVGALQISFLPGLPRNGAWRGLIENVHVSAAFRGRGFGGQMLEWAIAQCRARNCAIVQLTSNKVRTDAHRFYGRLGFVASHEGFKLTLD